MSHNSLGKQFVVTCFGESHGKCIGVVVDGCPPGITLHEAEIQKELDKRKPSSGHIFTSRKEADKVVILSGVFNEVTTGAPICMIIWNKEADSKPYEEMKWTPRPGHADYPAWIKFQGYNDYRGGGRFSGRITAAYVMAGTIAKAILNQLNIELLAHVIQIGPLTIKNTISYDKIKDTVYSNPIRCADDATAKDMEKLIMEVRRQGDSIGGIVEGIVLNMPVGIGHPIFNAIDADLAKALYAIPAVKGVEFGEGFNVATLRGSQNNDAYCLEQGKIQTLTNRAGGVLGGLSTGMPLVVRVAIKPTPSITQPQQTVHLQKKVETEIRIQGRHDACIVPRVVPVMEAIMGITVVDHLLSQGFIK